MLNIADLLYDDAAGLRFRLGNENLSSLRGENVSRLRSVHETGQFCREQLLSAAGRSRNQIGVREPILFMSPSQISKRHCARESHLDFRSKLRESIRDHFPNLILHLIG